MDNSLLKEAEHIINEYIKENGYSILPERRKRKIRTRLPGSGLFSNTVLDIFMLASIALLIYLVCRLF